MKDWIKTEKQLPAAGRKVISFFRNDHGNGRRIMAFHLPKYHQEASEFDDMDMDYCEKADAFFWPDGWYECVECSGGYLDYDCFPCHEEITHWCELPDFPDEKREDVA